MKTKAKRKPVAKPVEENEEHFRFAPSVDGAPSLHTDERIAMLAVCVAHQQSAGFKLYIDIREAKCPNCGAPGFNTGLGVWRHTCGAEWHSDGEPATDCPKPSVEP